MKLLVFLLTFIVLSLSFHLTHGGIFRRYVRKHRPGGGGGGGEGHHRGDPQMFMERSRMINSPSLFGRQFSFRQRPWPMIVRRARAPPIVYHIPLQYPVMLQTAQPVVRARAARRYRLHDRLDSSRVPQFHHQPVTARHHHHPIGISSTTRLPTTTALKWRPLDFGNPIDRDPTLSYAAPAIERVRFVTELRPSSARANTGMIGMYSRPAPAVVPAPWKRDPNPNLRARHPSVLPHHFPGLPGPLPPPRGAVAPPFPLWKLLAQKQRPRRPQRPARPPVRFIGQNPNHPLYHHQAVREEAEVFPKIANIVYFKPTDVTKTSYAKKTPPLSHGPASGKRPVSSSSISGTLKPGKVSNAQLYSKEVSSSSEFRPIARPTLPPSKKHRPAQANKDYQFTVVGFSGPSVTTTPMSPFASAPSTTTGTKRPPTVLYAVKTTPETLSTTHNSVVKPLEPTESLEPEEEEAASELRPVHMLPETNDIPPQVEDESNIDGREQGGVDNMMDFDNQEPEPEQQPAPVIPNSFNVFESLLSSFEKEFGGDTSGQDDDHEEDEILEVKHNPHQHKQRVPIFEPAEDSTLRGVLLPAEITTAPSSRNPNFETSTSVSVSVGISSSSSQKNKVPVLPQGPQEDEEEGDTDGFFANIRTVPTTTTTTSTSTTTTSTTTERPVTTSTTSTTTTTTPEPSSTTTKSSSFSRTSLPRLPTYKKNTKTPIYARKSSKAGNLLSKYSKPSEVSATGGGVPGSGEVVIITAGRSKVKEYKPQLIANQTHLLSFDRVVADSEGFNKESPIIALPSVDASPSTTSTKSPLEDFDAMQLLHSWLNKA